MKYELDKVFGNVAYKGYCFDEETGHLIGPSKFRLSKRSNNGSYMIRGKYVSSAVLRRALASYRNSIRDEVTDSTPTQLPLPITSQHPHALVKRCENELSWAQCFSSKDAMETWIKENPNVFTENVVAYEMVPIGNVVCTVNIEPF